LAVLSQSIAAAALVVLVVMASTLKQGQGPAPISIAKATHPAAVMEHKSLPSLMLATIQLVQILLNHIIIISNYFGNTK
jgi:hypothetical protein